MFLAFHTYSVEGRREQFRAEAVERVRREEEEKQALIMKRCTEAHAREDGIDEGGEVDELALLGSGDGESMGGVELADMSLAAGGGLSHHDIALGETYDMTREALSAKAMEVLAEEELKTIWQAAFDFLVSTFLASGLYRQLRYGWAEVKTRLWPRSTLLAIRSKAHFMMQGMKNITKVGTRFYIRVCLPNEE